MAAACAFPNIALGLYLVNELGISAVNDSKLSVYGRLLSSLLDRATATAVALLASIAIE